MEDHGVAEVIGHDHMYPTLSAAVAQYRRQFLTG